MYVCFFFSPKIKYFQSSEKGAVKNAMSVRRTISPSTKKAMERRRRELSYRQNLILDGQLSHRLKILSRIGEIDQWRCALCLQHTMCIGKGGKDCRGIGELWMCEVTRKRGRLRRWRESKHELNHVPECTVLVLDEAHGSFMGSLLSGKTRRAKTLKDGSKLWQR